LVAALVDDCPRYALDPQRPARLDVEPVAVASLPAMGDASQLLEQLLALDRVIKAQPLLENDFTC
jgi:hypothetical protein